MLESNGSKHQLSHHPPARHDSYLFKARADEFEFELDFLRHLASLRKQCLQLNHLRKHRLVLSTQACLLSRIVAYPFFAFNDALVQRALHLLLLSHLCLLLCQFSLLFFTFFPCLRNRLIHGLVIPCLIMLELYLLIFKRLNMACKNSNCSRGLGCKAL